MRPWRSVLTKLKNISHRRYTAFGLGVVTTVGIFFSHKFPTAQACHQEASAKNMSYAERFKRWVSICKGSTPNEPATKQALDTIQNACEDSERIFAKYPILDQRSSKEAAEAFLKLFNENKLILLPTQDGAGKIVVGLDKGRGLIILSRVAEERKDSCKAPGSYQNNHADPKQNDCHIEFYTNGFKQTIELSDNDLVINNNSVEANNIGNPEFKLVADKRTLTGGFRVYFLNTEKVTANALSDLLKSDASSKPVFNQLMNMAKEKEKYANYVYQWNLDKTVPHVNKLDPMQGQFFAQYLLNRQKLYFNQYFISTSVKDIIGPDGKMDLVRTAKLLEGVFSNSRISSFNIHNNNGREIKIT